MFKTCDSTPAIKEFNLLTPKVFRPQLIIGNTGTKENTPLVKEDYQRFEAQQLPKLACLNLLAPTDMKKHGQEAGVDANIK